MNASITKIFEHCAQLMGISFQFYGRAIRCPFHTSSTKKFSLHEEKGAWHCFSSRCPHPKGGILDVPVAFGIAADRSEAARWLSERGLIPPAEKQGDQPKLRELEKRLYINPNHLSARHKQCYYYAHVHLMREIGRHNYQRLRFLNGPYHYRRHQDLDRREDKLVDLFGAWIRDTKEFHAAA